MEPAATVERNHRDVDGSELIKQQLEAILMVVEEPVSINQLSLGLDVDPKEVTRLLRQLQEEYDGLAPNNTDTTPMQRGFQLRNVAGGWRIYARAEHHEVIEKFMVQGATTHLSQAGLEALAVIAYQQPTSRSRVAQIRGVNSDSVIRTLHTRGLIQEHGHDPLTQAVLYETTPFFLELLGLDSLSQLPKLSPYLPGAGEIAEINTEES